MTPCVLKLPDLSTPSVLQQTPWPCGFYQFPKRYKVQYFNPSIVDWQGHRWLVVRRRRNAIQPGKNDITFWRMQGETLLSEQPLKIPTIRADEHWEDPRAFTVGDQLWVSYSNFYTRCHWVHQGLCRVNVMLQAADICHPFYGDNGKTIHSNLGHEKNWIWFVDRENQVRMIYSAWPHTVVRFDNTGLAHALSGKGFRWTKGAVRGGTPPVFVEKDGLYWTFFHSSIDINPTPPRRRYFMGAYAFEPHAPFRIVMRSAKPILTGSEKDPREPSAPLCVFPCGALLDGETWHVTFGVNDCVCAWIKIPHEEMKEGCVKVR
jgi:predicted GH43/DUF377 family glycosyl hydrolase